MAPTDCPICDESFDAAGGLRSHAWEAHGACHYCGDRPGDGSDQDALYRHWLSAHPDDLTRVDYNRADDAVESLTFTDRLSNGGVGAAVGGLPRRAFLVGGGVAAIGGVAAGGVALSNAMAGGSDVSTDPAGPVGNAPVPSNPSEYRYAVMGTDDASASVTYYGSWKCPVCARFGETIMPGLVADYVEPGDVRIEFRDVAYLGGRTFLGDDAPLAGHGGLAVWNTDPEDYWRFHEVVFRNQPPEAQFWATSDKLASFAAASGVEDTDAVRAAVDGKTYEEALRATEAAAGRRGIQGTPYVVGAGRVVSGMDETSVRNTIEDAIANG
jgi:protein-disulfide isomerase